MMRKPMFLVFSSLLSVNTATAAELARMFFTPAQRATLDNARKQNIRIEIGNDGEQPQASVPVPQNVSVNGLIKRSDGKNTIWLNNRVVSEQQPGGIQAAVGKADNRVRLNVPESGRNIDLKVGQSVEIVSGTIEESYLRRPAPKLGAKAASANENIGSEVQRDTPAKTQETLNSEAVVSKRPSRASDRDGKDYSRTDNSADAK
jgi:hypothetical protein